MSNRLYRWPGVVFFSWVRHVITKGSTSYSHIRSTKEMVIFESLVFLLVGLASYLSSFKNISFAPKGPFSSVAVGLGPSFTWHREDPQWQACYILCHLRQLPVPSSLISVCLPLSWPWESRLVLLWPPAPEVPLLEQVLVHECSCAASILRNLSSSML